MSGSSVSIAVAGGEVGGYGYRPPFTAVQWQELEHQAMIYKYLVAGIPVPPDLVMPIRRSFEALSARFFHHPSLGYCSYYGKKFDPEPGRCRRTDGKKWRCSKDAYPDSKYCERHMHRGRNRSRKPVESQVTPNTSATLPTTRSGTFQNVSPYSVPSPEVIPFATSIPTKLQMEPVSFGIDNKDFRFGTELQQPSFFGSEINGPGPVKQEQRPMRPFFDEWPTTKESWVFDNEGSISGPGPVKQEQHSMRPFFDEWPMTKESWANLDDECSNKNAFSTTQLSISIPMDPPEFSSRD